MNNRCPGFLWLSISSIINFYWLSMPIDQLIDIDCHRLVIIFDALCFQSIFSKHGLATQLSEKVCCWRVVFQNTVSNCSKSVKVCFCSWFLKPFNCIQTILWTNSNRLKHSCVLRVRIRTCWNVAYREFFNANRWQSMSCDHFCVIIDWSSIGRCQSMPIN